MAPLSSENAYGHSREQSGTTVLTSMSSRSTLSYQTNSTYDDESSRPSTELRYNHVDHISPVSSDGRLTLVNEEDLDEADEKKHKAATTYEFDDKTVLPSTIEPADEEKRASLVNHSALTLTGNLLLDKAAADPLPPTLADPSGTEPEHLPKKAGIRAYRWLRWNFFSVYRRLFTVIFLANIAVLIGLLVRGAQDGVLGLTYTNTLDAAAANLLLAIFMRQEHVVNLLFWLSSSLPTSTPLWLRRNVAKIYSYGGVHSGCGSASVIWYLAFTGLATRHLVVAPFIEPVVVVLTYIILALLITIAVFAHPTLRMKFHDYFEATHRFAGWTAVALFWAQIVLVAHFNSLQTPGMTIGHALVTNPPFWCIVIITSCLIYPWLRLRNRTVVAEPLSDHAIRLHFDYTKVDYCMGVRLTDAPLKETHAFASLPNPDNAKGYSVVISNAGDWTKRVIQNPPQKMYVKGAPTFGVLRVAVMFDPVVVVATGSGIGPCMSLFNGRPGLNVRILWSTPSPLQTYGQGIIDAVLRADPKAVIVDTRAGGKSKRPDMVRLTYNLWKESGAEAVVIISNPKVTRKVVYGMETRGVPAYGPIWDS